MLSKKKATKKDYETVLNIWEKSAKATHNFLSKEDFDFYKEVIPQHLDYVDLSLWSDGQEIVGFSGISDSELVMLFLDPDFIGKRYGSYILTELMLKEGITKIDVNTQNEKAKTFYLNHGFEIVSEDLEDGFGKPYPITHLEKIK
jgi:putative acetyltransferase